MKIEHIVMLQSVRNYCNTKELEECNKDDCILGKWCESHGSFDTLDEEGGLRTDELEEAYDILIGKVVDNAKRLNKVEKEISTMKNEQSSCENVATETKKSGKLRRKVGTNHLHTDTGSDFNILEHLVNDGYEVDYEVTKCEGDRKIISATIYKVEEA